jgi:hypothetical protein
MPGDVGVHPGVVLAVEELLWVPRPYGGFWAFSKIADRASPPFLASAFPLEVPSFPRRVPDFIPAHIRPRFEAHFAGPGGLLPGHPMMAAEAAQAEKENRADATG